jgi:hypothetical protein
MKTIPKAIYDSLEAMFGVRGTFFPMSSVHPLKSRMLLAMDHSRSGVNPKLHHRVSLHLADLWARGDDGGWELDPLIEGMGDILTATALLGGGWFLDLGDYGWRHLDEEGELIAEMCYDQGGMGEDRLSFY